MGHYVFERNGNIMKINIVLPYKNAETQYKIWANEEENIDFRKEKEEAARCSICFAATELVQYLEKIGFQVSVSDKYRDTYNVVLKVVEKQKKDETGQEFSFRIFEDTLIIEGTGRVGVLYGVYELLKVQGVYWLNPWEEVLPQNLERLVLPESKSYKPSFDMGRGFEFEGTLKESKLLWLWMARNKLNLSTYRSQTAKFQKKLGMIFKQGGHIFESILKPDNVLASGKTIWEEHPEWYGLPKTGYRKKEEALYTQFCMGNDELLEYLAQNLVQKLQREWYHADRIDVWGFDTWGSECTCEKCKALGNAADQSLHFMSYLRNYLDKALEERKLDRRVHLVFCAYEGTSNLKPPANEIPDDLRDSGDYISYAPIVRCYKHRFDDENCDYNRYYNKNLIGWKGIPIGILEYYNVSKFEDLPFLFTKTMANDIRYYHRLNVRCMTYMHLPMICWGVRNLTQILYAELCWNVETNADDVMSTYFQKRYGIHGESMKRAYDLIEKAGEYCTSWRAWCQHSILSNLHNWDGKRPKQPLSHDSHLVNQTIQKGMDAVSYYASAIGILEEEMQKAENEYIKKNKFIAGIPINPTDTRFKAVVNIYGERIREDLMSVMYAKDCMELITYFVSYYEALEKGLDSDSIFRMIEKLAGKMSMYYVPIRYDNPEPEIHCLDALTRSQLKDLFYRCKADRLAHATTGHSLVAICGYHGWSDWYLAANLGDSSRLDGSHLPDCEVICFMYNVKDYGAVGNGKTLDSTGIQKAIDACSENGGGTVFIPAGKYVCGTMHLKSHVHILFEKGALILGSKNIKDFDPLEENPSNNIYQDLSHSYFHHSLFHADNVNDIALTGFGTIDMQSEWEIAEDWCRACKIIAFKECTGVVIRDLTMKNATDLAVYLAGCEYVTISGLSMAVHVDGISPDSCRNVTISDCFVDAGDDAIVPKCSFTLGRFKSMENLTISNCVVRSSASAIKFGTESNSSFRNITVTGCTIYDTGLKGIALQACDGAVVEGFSISNITMRNVGTPILIMVVDRARGPKPECLKIGEIKNISISNITITGPYPEEYEATMAQNAKDFYENNLTIRADYLPFIIAGQKDSVIKNISLANIQFVAPGGGTAEDRNLKINEVRDGYPIGTRFAEKFPIYGLFARNVDNLKLYNVDFMTEKEDKRDAILLENVTNYKNI